MGDFVFQLYEQGGKGLFDAIAVHPYAATPRDVIAKAQEARAVINRFHDDAALWITEVGWASGGRPVRPHHRTRAPGGLPPSSLELAAADRERLGLDGLIWYSLNDTPGPLWPGHCGLFTVDGTAKPSWAQFVELTGGSS